jgi:hypothetical protein
VASAALIGAATGSIGFDRCGVMAVIGRRRGRRGVIGLMHTAGHSGRHAEHRCDNQKQPRQKRHRSKAR